MFIRLIITIFVSFSFFLSSAQAEREVQMSDLSFGEQTLIRKSQDEIFRKFQALIQAAREEKLTEKQIERLDLRDYKKEDLAPQDFYHWGSDNHLILTFQWNKALNALKFRIEKSGHQDDDLLIHWSRIISWMFAPADTRRDKDVPKKYEWNVQLMTGYSCRQLHSPGADQLIYEGSISFRFGYVPAYYPSRVEIRRQFDFGGDGDVMAYLFSAKIADNRAQVPVHAEINRYLKAPIFEPGKAPERLFSLLEGLSTLYWDESIEDFPYGEAFMQHTWTETRPGELLIVSAQGILEGSMHLPYEITSRARKILRGEK